MENNEENEYSWFDWEESVDVAEMYYLTIVDSEGEEYALIAHRTCNGDYPLDGELAESKRERAQFIVDALNATL